MEKKKKKKEEKVSINTKDIKGLEISLNLSVPKEEFDKLLKNMVNCNKNEK